MERMEIKIFNGPIVGFIDIDPNGNKTVKDYGGRILGYYNSQRNETTDFYRRVIAYGDITGIFFKDKIKI